MDKHEKCRKSPHLVLIEDNVFEIPQRLKAMDSSYFVVWNNLKKKFEVHNEDNVGTTYCFTVPYKELDNRTLDYARETRAERSDIIFAEMEKQNEMIEKTAKKDRENLFNNIGREVFEKAMFEERTSKEV